MAAGLLTIMGPVRTSAYAECVQGMPCQVYLDEDPFQLLRDGDVRGRGSCSF